MSTSRWEDIGSTSRSLVGRPGTMSLAGSYCTLERHTKKDAEILRLEIGDNFIALTTRTLSHEDYQKLVQTIAPTTVAYSFWASCRHLFDLKIKEIFGLPVHSDAQSPFGTQNSGASTEGPVRKPGGSTGAGLTPPGVVPSVGADSSSNIGLPQTPDTSSKEPQSRALSTFLSGLSLNRRPAFTEAPRGSIILSGLVEVVGSKARATMDVTAVYDLASDKYLSINVMGRRIAELKQRPRG
jgi:hypothetical protein